MITLPSAHELAELHIDAAMKEWLRTHPPTGECTPEDPDAAARAVRDRIIASLEAQGHAVAVAWCVNLNDCDYAYVIAENESQAIDLALAVARETYGEMSDDDLMSGDEPVGVERVPELDGESFTYAQLVALKHALELDDDPDLHVAKDAILISTEW